MPNIDTALHYRPVVVSTVDDALAVGIHLKLDVGALVHFDHLDIPTLIAEAGGDPWAVNETLQAGRPELIADLAKAFHDAGRCTSEADAAFDEACRRFEAAWTGARGTHPINGSAEVQRATRSLGVQAAHLPKIGLDLEHIAIALADTQKAAAQKINALNSQLKTIDDELGRAIELENQGGLTSTDEALVDEHINELGDDAVARTKASLQQLQSLRGDYSRQLQDSLTTLRAQDGYDPAASQGYDVDGQMSLPEREQTAVEAYNTHQRAKDQAILDNPQSSAGDRADATQRLKDFATITDPHGDPESQRLASERLGDFNTSQFSGPMPVDPVLGVDARTRAQMRLDWQKKLEQGLPGTSSLPADQATQLLDDGEQHARAFVTQEAIRGLVSKGMSPTAATAAAGDISRGVPWADIVRQQGQIVTLAGAGADGSLAARGGRHAVSAFTSADVEAFERAGKIMGRSGTLAEVALATNDYLHGAGFGVSAGKAGGSIAGGWLGATAGGAAFGSAFGPEGAFVGAMVGAAFFGFVGGEAGGAIGGQFDK